MHSFTAGTMVCYNRTRVRRSALMALTVTKACRRASNPCGPEPRRESESDDGRVSLLPAPRRACRNSAVYAGIASSASTCKSVLIETYWHLAGRMQLTDTGKASQGSYSRQSPAQTNPGVPRSLASRASAPSRSRTAPPSSRRPADPAARQTVVPKEHTVEPAVTSGQARNRLTVTGTDYGIMELESNQRTARSQPST